MNENEMVEMIVKFYVPGAENADERKKAESIGLKAYKMGRPICNKIIIPIWNKLFEIFAKNYTKEDYLDEDKLYTKGYLKICNGIGKLFVLLNGGYWFKKKRKVRLNYGFSFTPVKEDDCGGHTHYVDDMITIEKMGV